MIVRTAARVAVVAGVLSLLGGMAFTRLPSEPSGRLLQPLATMSASQFFAFANGLTFVGGSERNRLCKGTPECEAGTARTRARIEAVMQEPLRQGNISPEGTVVFRVRNIGEFAERPYGIMPGATNFLVAYPSPDSGVVAVWKLVEASPHAMRTIATGNVVSCNHGSYLGSPRADFRSCSNAAAMHKLSGEPASIVSGDGDPYWFTCGLGCCTSSGVSAMAIPPQP